MSRMLDYLKIRDLALIDEAEVEFGRGLTVVTGETGAGKSIFLGSLGLLAGGRSRRELVRDGAAHASVEAILRPPSGRVAEWLMEQGLPPMEEGQLAIRRQVGAERSGRVFINGSVATVAQLRELGELWVDFHGPGEHHGLIREDRQLELLDAFAGHDELLQRCDEAWKAWRARWEERERIFRTEQLSGDELSFLQSELDKLDGLELEVEAIEALEAEASRLQNAELWLGRMGQLRSLLEADETPREALQLLQQLTAIDADCEALEERMETLTIEWQDLAAEVGAFLEEAEFNGEHTEQVQLRLAAWLEAERRYGPGPEEVARQREAIRERIALQADAGTRLAQVEAELEQAQQQLQEAAEILHGSRKEAAARFCKAVRKRLQGLGLGKARLEARFTHLERCQANGDHRLSLLFEANAGQALKPLARVASSGELARLMLAIKAVLAEGDQTPLLVFDEVDANVGGEVGVEVGAVLEELGSDHQVFCITHLPQVAARARSHMRVRKQARKTRTEVEIESVNASEKRIDELARMLGDRRSKAARSHAKTLLGV